MECAKADLQDPFVKQDNIERIRLVQNNAQVFMNHDF